MRHLSKSLSTISLASVCGMTLAAALGSGAAASPAPAPEATAPAASTSSTGSSSTGSEEHPLGAYEVAEGLLPFYTQDIAWEDCSTPSTIAQCATIEVPLDYADPTGRAITLALKRIPASDGEAEKGSLFTNPGGPGLSGVAATEGFASTLESDARAAYDVIGFDPRGVGASTPLTCWSQEELDAYLAQAQGGELNRPQDDPGAPAGGTPVDDPQQAAEEVAAAQGQPQQAPVINAESMVAEGRAMATACAQYSQVPEILDHMDTDTVVRDLDLMRAVVGDETLSYLGVSYGTSLGAEYLEAFPLNAGTVVLDSAVDPTITYQDVVDGQIAHREYALRTFVEQWQATGTSPLTGSPEEAKNQLGAWLDGLDAAPLTVDGTEDTLGRAQTRELITTVTLAHQDYWPEIHESLAQAMSTGNGTALRTSALAVDAAKRGTAAPQTTSVPSREQVIAQWNFEYSNLGVFCSSYPVEGDEAGWDAHAADIEASWPVYADPTTSYGAAVCAGWGHAEDAEQPAPVSGEGSQDVLVVGSYDDSATPYPWSVALADQLDRGHLLTANAPIHGAVLLNSCANSAINDYLMDGALPAEGTICPADPRRPVMPAPQG